MHAIIFIGIPASGKSSFYKNNFSDTHIRINLDMLKTRYREQLIFDACIKSKAKMVIDNTNLTKFQRSKYIEKLKLNHYELYCYYFVAEARDCVHRLIERNKFNPIKIPIIAVYDGIKRLERPSLLEGYDKLYHIELKENKFEIKEQT